MQTLGARCCEKEKNNYNAQLYAQKLQLGLDGGGLLENLNGSFPVYNSGMLHRGQAGVFGAR